MANSYVIYDRSAVTPQAGVSPNAERIELCKAIMAATGGDLIGVFEDIGVSGSEGAEAPVRDQLMKRVKAGDIDHVVAPDPCATEQVGGDDHGDHRPAEGVGRRSADRARLGARMTTPNLDYELWRRVEDRRDAALNPESAPQEQKLLSLALSLARLSAQRDSLAGLQG